MPLAGTQAVSISIILLPFVQTYTEIYNQQFSYSINITAWCFIDWATNVIYLIYN